MPMGRKRMRPIGTLEAEAYGVPARYLIKMGERKDALALFHPGTLLGQCGDSTEY